jgi:polyhydroxyalkanoate synthase subunit PhaC
VNKLALRPGPSVTTGPVKPAVVHAGTREREQSPWLGHRAPASEAFTRLLALERAWQAVAPKPLTIASTATAANAFEDWALHVALSPAKQAELALLAAEHTMAWWNALPRGAHREGWCVQPLPQDKRFTDPAWCQSPWGWGAQGFLLCQDWWHRATTAVPGVSRRHENMVEFAARQWLDMLSPSNSVMNPVVLQRTVQEKGANLLRGAAYALDDAWREAMGQPPAGAEQFQVGKNVAATPGHVVLRNRLMELIQYTPTTPTVHAEPVLIVPAWIMKYYVLDLEAEQSLVKYLVDQGHAVFVISWKNPDSGDRDLAMADYDQLGVRAAIRCLQAAMPGRGIYGVGYCLGGTLLAMTAAALGRAGDTALKTLTLLAAQTDFTDPGELSLFVDESHVAALDNAMARQGFLDKRAMAASFQMLRSRDLVWSHRVSTYLLGQRAPMNALMAWNADGTRMPARMHSEYLRALYLDNALAHGDYTLAGEPVSLSDIHQPLFLLGTVQDHVAPWRSVFKLHDLTHAEKTFVLTSGGHNVGIVNPPGSTPSSYRLRHWKPGDRLLTPDAWLAAATLHDGSWWPAWSRWLAKHSQAKRVRPVTLPSLGAAPGRYVHAP